ncbi:aldehyde dehydrogenase family protein [Paenisporosarcina sp. TG-14]|uniref:aldehyde dehydrogenase family protein n=1 Tax=Paenisporosarcina sp. TG-14 TaxID=1231057 RepID=UPI00031C86CA|nr:aldehyde dehydrogenase family protein [Paenisporosarcina sp. TG-14]
MGTTVKTPTYGLFINGEWREKANTFDVLNKYNNEVIARASYANEQDVTDAVKAAKDSLKTVFPPYARYEILKRVAEELIKRKQEIGEILAEEVGKPIAEAIGEVERAAQTLEISAEESKRIHGQGIPVEAAPGSENRQAFTKRVPVGVVAAITPFNVPLNLICHKVGPALAAGNSVVLKPAKVTSVSAIILTEIFEEVGLPSGRLNLVTGNGSETGEWLLKNQDVNMYTFTGSPSVGKLIREKAGLRKVALELGSNSATIVHKDANIEQAATLTAQKSFNNAGQVCISVQRVYIHKNIFEEFMNKMKAVTNSLVVGDPKDPSTNIGPMISEKEAIRVEQWVNEAVSQGAKVETGGYREGVFYKPTILSNVTDDMNICRQEIFGPVVTVDTYSDEDEVIDRVNDSDFGLQAGLFTNSLAFAMKAANLIEVGGLIINDTSGYRVDQMPYGGVKQSGTGKEGPKYAIEEMTEERIIVLNL